MSAALRIASDASKKMPSQEKKLFIHHDYDDVESGPAELVGEQGETFLMRLLYIPFMYATPTYGDVVAAKRDEEFDGHYAFACPEAGGMEVEDLHEHGGRYALIVDFEVAEGEGKEWFEAELDILSSLAWRQEDGKPGRTYLAAQSERSPSEVMRLLRARHPESHFVLVHPSEG